LSRPGLEEILSYRRHIDVAMADLLAEADPALIALVELGLHHEQQHQELILTDILHAFAQNPLRPAALPPTASVEVDQTVAPGWSFHPGGVVEIGHGGVGFCFDNEQPRHAVLLRPCRLAARLVTNGEYRAFIDDGGYRRPELWLSDGWAVVQAEGWGAPLYWIEDGQEMTLQGSQPLKDGAPVRHVSYYEADAYARWAGKRLPLEAEWEAAAPLPQMFGEVWQWTASPYAAYPGFRPAAGAVGEYNGKFMINQMVLRGSSRVTPSGHERTSYRNFFYPGQRWQFAGIRLAEDA
jgi:ergothioneine biosynthesis protein EgtB